MQQIENPEEFDDLDWADYQCKEDDVPMQQMPSLEEQKAIGKQFYEAHNYMQAYTEYCKCLDLCEFKDDIATIYSNMSMCCIKLGMYEQSMADITQALERSTNVDIKPDIMIKLRHRLALSLAHLRDYDQSASILKHLKKYCNLYERLDMWKVCEKLHLKVCELLNNQSKGKYRGEIFAGIQGHRPTLNDYDYLEESDNVFSHINDYVSDKVQIREGDEGRGVFATRPIKKGELIMAAQAICCVVRDGNQSKKLVQQLMVKQEKMKLSTTLHLNYMKGGPLEDKAISTFEQYFMPLAQFVLKRIGQPLKLLSEQDLTKIVQQNAFSSKGPVIRAYYGQNQVQNQRKERQLEDTIPTESIFGAPSFINHSCVPNTHQSFFREDSSVIFIKAIRDIDINDQITISYIDLLQPFKERQNTLKQRWGFDCHCQRCDYEIQLSTNEAYAQLLQMSSIDFLLTPKEPSEVQIETERSKLQQQELERSPAFTLRNNYVQMVSLLDDLISKFGTDSSGALILNGFDFDTYTALAYSQCLQLFANKDFKQLVPTKSDIERKVVLEIFFDLQQRTQAFFLKHQRLFPQLLSQAIDQIYFFKNNFDDGVGTVENGLSSFNQLDPASEEKMFNVHEQMYQVLYPVDWVDASWVFHCRIKQTFDQQQ